MDLSRLGEDGLLRLLTEKWRPLQRGVLTGVGDDCAVLRGGGRDHFLLFKTDAVVEGVHFTSGASPAAIGHKALARALSDIAAMGGKPLAALITLGLPARESPRRVQAIYRGLEKTAKKFRVDLVGGETTRARQLFLNISLLGECRGYRPILRSGARAGDRIFVTGRLGGSQKGRHLAFVPRLAEGAWLAKEKMVSAMMDLSDGLAADLPRLGEAAKAGFSLQPEAFPRQRGVDLNQAVSEGEDYELLFTVKPAKIASLIKRWPFATPLHGIGVMTSTRGGSSHLFAHHGFDHFKQP